jgi:hypothetical protein
MLPWEKKKMIEAIDRGIEQFDKGMLDVCLRRTTL